MKKIVSLMAEADDGTYWKSTNLDPWVQIDEPPEPTPEPPPANQDKIDFYNRLGKKLGERDTLIKKLGLSTDKALAQIYYDGELANWNAATHFNMEQPFRDYANNCNFTYSVYYGASSNWKLPGNWVFAESLAERYLRTHEPKALADLNALMKNANYMTSVPGQSGLNDQGRTPSTRHEISREFAYCVLGYTELERCQALSAPQKERRHECSRDSLIIIDDWSGKIGKPPQEQQASYFRPFMGGITAHAEINIYEITTLASLKSTIIQKLIQLADYAWKWCWLEDKLTFRYTDRDGLNPDDANPSWDLNMLIAPWFAWLWSVTKDPAWKEKAQKIFKGSIPVYSADGFHISGAYLGTAENPQGKVIDQQLVWDKYFDYIEVV